MYLQDEWKITQGDAQLRGALRCFQLILRPRKPTQPTRQSHLHTDGLNDPARRLRALFHAAAGGKRLGGDGEPVRRHVERLSITRNTTRCRARELFRRRHHPENHQGLQVGVDGYYKNAKNQLDDGLFGQSLILRASIMRGGGFMAWNSPAPIPGGFSTYANVAYSVAQGENGVRRSSCSTDGPGLRAKSLDYLDHDQGVTGSFGASYLLKESDAPARAFIWTRFTAADCGRTRRPPAARTFPTAAPFRPTTRSTAARNRASRSRQARC